MRNSLALFNTNITLARDISALHEFLTSNVVVPLSFDDLLRSQIVYAVSAFDKLLHDLIRIGMVEIFLGNRAPTAKYLAEPIPMQIHEDIISATIPPKEYIFEQAVFRKLKFSAYQEPTKVAEGLSYIWDEPQKWQKIAVALHSQDRTVKTTLKLIADRRNTIVHEADIDPLTNLKFSINKMESEFITSFLHQCGTQIAHLVT